MNIKKLSQSSIALMLVIVVAKLIGMFRDVVLANYFGTSNISDAYLIAVSVPTLLFYFIGHSLSTAYIPMYNKVRAEQGNTEAQKYTNNILTIALILSTVIVILLAIFPEFVVKLFAAGFDADTSRLAVKFIRISSLSIYFMTAVNIMGGSLQANKHFLAPAAISLPRNFSIVVSVVIAATYGIEWLGIGLLAAYVLEFIFLLPVVVLKGFHYQPMLRLKDESIKQTLYIIAPILLGMCVGQVNKIIDRSMASTVVEGGISALSYASIINNAVQEVLVTGIITILFASCAELVAKGQHEAVKQKLSNVVNTLIFLLIPACIGIIVLAEPIVSLVLCRGEFDANSLQMTASSLRCYTIGLLFLAMRDTLVKVFYAYKDTKVTTATSIIAILLNIVLNLILGRFLGIQGLALATSISAAANCIMLYILLTRKIGNCGIRSMLSVLIKSILSAVAMGLCVYYVFSIMTRFSPEFTALIVSVLAGILSYLLFSIILLNPPIINTLKNLKNLKLKFKK